MKKYVKIISSILATSMLLSNIAYASELIERDVISSSITSAISYGVDKMRNSTENAFSAISLTFETTEEAETETFQDPGMELDINDIQDLYDIGYELSEIEEAIKLSSEYEKTPYEILLLKGQKVYIPNEIEVQTDEESANLSGEGDSDDEVADELPEYDFSLDEKSWDSVLMDLNKENSLIDENQWEFVKLSGIDEFLDESMLSDEEKAVLENIDLSSSEENANLSGTSSNPDILDTYNNYIFPKSIHDQVNQGSYISTDDVYVNEVTGNNIVKETDLTLKGRNGLDLNLTRYYSISDANDSDVTVKKTNGSLIYKNVAYYAVKGNIYVRIFYKNGDSIERFTPGYVVYVTADGRIISKAAFQEDVARVQDGNESLYMFESREDAEECIENIKNGDYNYTIDFSSLENSNIEKIDVNLSDDDTFSVDNPFDEKESDGVDVKVTVAVDGSKYENEEVDSEHSKYFKIGIGWSFDFPYIEQRYYEDEKTIYRYLHMGASGVWQINDDELVGYPLNDLELTEGDGKFNNKSIQYTLTEKSGKKYHFGYYGQLLGIEDRYGNQILFNYNIEDRYPILEEIIDSTGRVVSIEYEDENRVLIKMKDENSSIERCVAEYTISDGKLTSVTDAEGYVTSYDYLDMNCDISMVSKDLDSPIEVKYSRLSYISYPTGAVKRIAYKKLTKNCGLEGTMEIPACSFVYLYETDAEYNMLRSDKTYTREIGKNDDFIVYDGYPIFRSISEVTGEYRIYSNTKTITDQYKDEEERNQKGAVTELSIYALSNNDNWLKESVTTEYIDLIDDGNSTYRELKEYEYNSSDLCIKETSRVYNDYDNSTDEYVQTVKTYKYDPGNYGDITEEKVNELNDRTTKYTYDQTYHIPTQITYKQDEDKEVVLNYELTDDNKSVASVKVTENNSTKKQHSYTYDNYGNVIFEKRYTGDNNWQEYIEIAYSYDDGRDIANKLNGVYLNEISVSGIKDADGNLITGTESGTITQSYLYDWYGNTISETDANGQTYQYEYDKNNRMIKIINPDLTTKEYSFVVEDDINDVYVKDENGNVIKYSYTETGTNKSVMDVTNNVLLTENIMVDVPKGGIIRETVQYSIQNGHTTTKEMYNRFGQLIELKVLDSSDNVLHYEKNEYQYAVDGFLNKTINTVYGDTEDETVQNIQYTDVYGNVVKEEVVYNEDGETKSLITEYTYDLLGNLKTVREPRAAAENWAADKYTAQYEYDVAGNVTKVTDYNNNSVVNEYDGLGRLTSVTDKNGNTTLNTYDAVGRLLQEKIPFQKNGTSTVYAVNKYYYDANGNVTKSQTANNAVGSTDSYRTTEYQYNWQNQPTKVRGFDGSDVENCVQYYYDSVGNLLRMYTGNVDELVINDLDSLSGDTSDYAVTKYAYDSMNRCISQIDAQNQTIINTYDINGNLIQTKDRNGNTLSYKYDGLNQLLEKSSDKTTNDTYTYAYNKKGLRTSMTGGGTETISVYDNLGRLTKESLTNGDVKEYTYDVNGNRTSFKLTHADAVQYTLTYEYDKMNQLTKVYEDGTVKAEYEYNDDGTLKKSSYGAQTTDYSYNLANLLTEVNNANEDTQISKYNYTYYVDGNQQSKEESVAGVSKGITNYTYDGLNRLVQEQTPSKTMSYQYDSYGNRSQLSVTGDETYSTNYTYDKNNRLRNQTKTIGTASEMTDFWYDPNGNQISSMTVTTDTTATGVSKVTLQSAGQSTNSLSEYNSWNQLTKSIQNGKVASYTYNGDGLRMSKTVDGVTTSHIWDGTNIVGDVTNNAVTKYIRGLQLISSKTGENENFYTYNGHGDIVQLTDSTGRITKEYTYDAFGVEQDIVSNDTNPFRYCGEYYDKENGNIYLRARYYSPVQGIFTTEDPIRDGLNWYSYCDGNPISYIDYSGMAKSGDERLTQKERDVIEIYSTIWFDAQTAYEAGIITEWEKNSVQFYAESRADEIRYAHDHPFLTWGSNVLEFALFDVVLGDFDTIVYAADFSEQGLNKMYNNPQNFATIVAAGVAKGFTGGESRTIGNTKVKGKDVRVDIEMPTGKSTGNIHIHYGNEKIYIDSVDDIADLSKSLRKSDKVVDWVKKAVRLLNKLR